MAVVGKLESIPTELQIFILEHLPDTGTLSALVHASPVLHDVYRAKREGILTAVTIQELRTRDHQPFLIDEILKPAAICHLVTSNKEVNPNIDPNLKPALKACQAQAHASANTQFILSVDHCIALRTIVYYYGWQIERRRGEILGEIRVAWNDKPTYEEWSARLQYCFLHVLIVGEFSPDEVVFMSFEESFIGEDWAPKTTNKALRVWYDNKPQGRTWIGEAGQHRW